VPPPDAAQIEQLQQQLAAIESQVDQSQAFQVATTVYLLDTAGLHAMDESINQENTIDPGFPGTVDRIRRLMALTAWPEELQEDARALEDTLASFAAALAEDDVEAAKPLATQVHDQQHELSHAVEGWLSEHGFVAHEEGHGHSQ
jgi:hypothetical protein